jgi:CBS domain-containing protein
MNAIHVEKEFHELPVEENDKLLDIVTATDLINIY